MSIGEDIYTGTADIGKIKAIFGVIIANIIGIILIIIAIRYKNKTDDSKNSLNKKNTLIAGILIIIFAWIILFLIFKFKFLAASEGASEILKIV